MFDWEQLVRARLGPLRLARQREAEVVAELAAHLEDAYDSASHAGAKDGEAIACALAGVPDWGQLARALGAEGVMRQRVRTLWVPGLATALLAYGALLLLTRAGVRPHILWLSSYGGHAVTFYLPWLVVLPLIGAIAAAWSRRTGGSRRDSLLAAALPPLAFAAFLLCMLALSLVLETQVPLATKVSGLGAFLLGWVVAPGIALLLGALPCLDLRQRRDAATMASA